MWDAFFSQGRRASAFRCFTEAQEADQSCCVQLSQELPAISHCAKWSVVISCKHRSGFSFSLSPQFICSLSSLCQVPADRWKAYIDIKCWNHPVLVIATPALLGWAWFSPGSLLRSKLEVSATGLLLYPSVTLEEAKGSSTSPLNRRRVRPAWVCCWPFLMWWLLCQPTGFPAHGVHLVRSGSSCYAFHRHSQRDAPGAALAAHGPGPHSAFSVWQMASANTITAGWPCMALPGEGIASGCQPGGSTGGSFISEYWHLSFTPPVSFFLGITRVHCRNCCSEFLGGDETFGDRRSRTLSPHCLKLAET